MTIGLSNIRSTIPNEASITANKSVSNEQSKSNTELIPVSHSENLPAGWVKMAHPTTGEEFYINQESMVSQRHSPNDVAESMW